MKNNGMLPVIEETRNTACKGGETNGNLSRNANSLSRDDAWRGLRVLYEKNLGDLLQRSLAGFAAGGMVAASIWSLLIPEMSQGKHSNVGTVFFAVGFSVMMTLDVALG